MRTLSAVASKRVISRMPFLASCCPARNASAPTPMGVTGPTPVTTTLLILVSRVLDRHRVPGRASPGVPLLLLVRYEPDRVTDGADAPAFILGYLSAELVFPPADQLDDVKRIGTDVLDEPRVSCDLAGVGVALVGNDVLELLPVLVLVHVNASFARHVC